MVVGPDAYKDIPNLLAEVEDGKDAVNVIYQKMKPMEIFLR